MINCNLCIPKATSSPLFRMEEIRPQFRLDSLEPGREYQLQIFGVNAKGRSSPAVVIEKVRVSPQLGPYGKEISIYFNYFK